MRRAVARTIFVTSCLLLASLGAGGTASRAAQDAELELKVATTKRKVKVFGTFSGPRRAPNVRLRLIHSDQTVERRVPLQDDGYFIGAFGRPEQGSCKVRAVYRSGDGTLRDSLTLPCERPDWGTGTATLIDMDTNDTVTLGVEIADTFEERQYGLMYRKWLHPERGMAFTYPGTTSGGYWMANCLIPLSIAFFDETGEIVSILDMYPCEPQGSTDCPTYDPEVEYSDTLEVNLNHFDVWNIEPGDRILIHPDP